MGRPISQQFIGIKTSKSKIKNQITLTQLLDKAPTLTEKIFQKFLLKKIELIGLQIEVKCPGLKRRIYMVCDECQDIDVLAFDRYALIVVDLVNRRQIESVDHQRMK